MKEQELKNAALATIDHIDDINDMRRAMTALADLVGGENSDEAAVLGHISRVNLSYLIMAVNRGAEAAIERANDVATSVHRALCQRANAKAQRHQCRKP
ncbi:MAG: hypothetical protein LBE62_12730 [Azonexus sp.]|jgi:hypothetical protein|nr:hypothetical protein [Azonexus sp.]